MRSSLLWLCAIVAFSGSAKANYFGKSLGKLSEFHHGVSGHVYAVDGRTLFIKDFTYDGEGPAAFFYVGNTKAPSNNGAQRLRDERGSTGVLKRYRGKNITLTLPEGKTFHSIRWFSVWCDEFSVNFGDVKIPRNLDYPKPQKISGLSGVHAVSSDPIVIVDAQTLLIPNFSYDGEAPDAKFWVGRGDKPSPQGIRIPDENGKTTPLRSYDHKTIVLTLPGDLTIFDIGHFGVWCEAFTVDFGHIKLPELPNVPPSLKMLGVSPQKRNQELVTSYAVQSTYPTGNRQSQTATNKDYKYQDQNGNIRPTTYRPPTVRFSNQGISNLEQPNRFEAPLNVNDAAFQLLYPVAPSAIHRRADEFQSPNVQQLQRNYQFDNYNQPRSQYSDKESFYGQKSIIQPSREIYVNQDSIYKQNLLAQQQQQLQQQQQQQQQLYYNQQQLYQQYNPQLLQNQYQQQQQQQQIYQQNQYQQPLYQTHQIDPNQQYQSQANPQQVAFAQRRFDLDLGSNKHLANDALRSLGRFSLHNDPRVNNNNNNAYVQYS